MSCEDIPSLLDLQKVKKHADDFGRLMGTGTGISTNGVTGQVRPTYNAVMANLGYTRVGTFASGGTLLNGRQTLLWDIADGGDGQEYGWSGVFPPAGKFVPPGSTPLTTGGIAVGAWVSRFDPELRVQVREALRRSYAKSGSNLVDGSFEAGGTLANANDVLLQESTGKAFSGPAGVVAAGTDPTSGGFVDSSVIRAFDSVAAMRTVVGSVGQTAVLVSYNSGWAAETSPPKGGGKFRWVEDNALVDDGVFIFKPSSSTGAWVRQYQKKVTPYLAGAKGDDIDDTDAILRCFDAANAKLLNVHIGKGKYRYTQTPTVGPVCSVAGEFAVAELFPVGCDGIKFTSSDAVGGRKFGGFTMLGAGANSAGYTAIRVDPSQDVSKRTTGVSFEDIQIFNFKTAVDAKNLWHSTFRSFNATNVCNGIIFRGRCVSNEVGSGTKLIRGNGALVSGECIGVQYIESTDYTPSVAARPEGCTITQSVLVFGFDVLVDVDSMLAGGIYGADLDYGRSRGVRYRFWDGNPTIAPNWIAGDAGQVGQPFIGVEARPVASQRTTCVSIDHITMTTFNGNPGDCGIRIGSLNGRARISKTLISNQNGYGVYFDGSRFNTLKDCQINSTTPLYMFSSGGNQIDGNTISGGGIFNDNPTSRNLWGKNDGEFCTEDTLVVPIAAGATSGSLNLASAGYARGVPAVGDIALTCFSTGPTNPGSTWAEISPDGMTLTAHKTVAFGVDTGLFVKVQIAS